MTSAQCATFSSKGYDDNTPNHQQESIVGSPQLLFHSHFSSPEMTNMEVHTENTLGMRANETGELANCQVF